MDNVEVQDSRGAKEEVRPATNMSLELAVIAVSDVERAKLFYSSLGWHLDIDHSVGEDYRIVQFSPPGSACAIMFGKNIANAQPGSSRGLHVIVADLPSAREDLIQRGISVSEPFHDVGGIFHHSNGHGITKGLNPERKSYASYATFEDPDGNAWTLQEITARLPGVRGDTRFTPQLTKAVWGD